MTAVAEQKKTATNTGVITQIVGPIVDVHFTSGNVPALLNALTVENGDKTLTFEVAQHVGLDRVRAIAMEDTQGLTRGMPVTSG